MYCISKRCCDYAIAKKRQQNCALLKVTRICKFVLVFLSLMGRVACAPQMEIINGSSSNGCYDFVELEGNFQSVTFQVSGNNADYVIDVFDGPVLRYSDGDNPICRLKDSFDNCGLFTADGYTCLCEQISSTEYHLTFNITTHTTDKAYDIYMKWPKLRDSAVFVTSSAYTIKAIKDLKCGPPKIEIISSDSSKPVCDDFIPLRGNFQSVTFNVTGSNAEYVIDRSTVPAVRYVYGNKQLCELMINGTNQCGLLITEGYTCLCEEISSVERHLTFNSTTKTPLPAFAVYMRWGSSLNVNDFLGSKIYTLKEVRDETCELNSGTPVTPMDKLKLGLIAGGSVVSACRLLGLSGYF